MEDQTTVVSEEEAMVVGIVIEIEAILMIAEREEALTEIITNTSSLITETTTSPSPDSMSMNLRTMMLKTM